MIALLAAALLAASAAPPPLPDVPGAARVLSIAFAEAPGGPTALVGTPAGLFVLPAGADRWTLVGTAEGLPDPYVAALAVWNGRIWVGTAGGLAVLTPALAVERVYTTRNMLPDDEVTALLPDGASLWVGTAAWGIARLDSATRRFEYQTTAEGLPSSEIVALGRGAGTVWAATNKRGLARLEPDGRWRAFGEEDGLPTLDFRALDGDGDEIWAGARLAGVCVYDAREDRWRTIREGADGLSDDFVNAVRLDGRAAWVGTPEGVDRVDRDARTVERFPVEAPARRGSGIGGETAASAAPDVSTLGCRGGTLWIGWGAAGLSTAPKGIETVRLAPDLSVEERVRGLLRGAAAADRPEIDVRSGDEWAPAPAEGVAPSPPGLEGDRPLALLDLSDVSENEVTVRLRAGGNRAVERYRLDRGAPRLEVRVPVVVRVPRVRLSGRVDERDVREVRVEGRTVAIEGGAFLVDLEVPGESRTVVVEARDAAGNVAAETREILVDTEAPRVLLEEPPEEVRHPVLLLRGRVEDRNLRDVVVDPGARRAAVDPVTRAFEVALDLAPGRNQFEVRAVDRAENASVHAFRVDFRPDSGYQPFRIWPVVSPIRWNRTAVIGGSIPPGVDRVVVDPGRVEASVNPFSGTFVASVDLADGENVFTVTASGPSYRQAHIVRIVRIP